MTTQEIRDRVMSMESTDVRNELAALCEIVACLEDQAKQPHYPVDERMGEDKQWTQNRV